MESPPSRRKWRPSANPREEADGTVQPAATVARGAGEAGTKVSKGVRRRHPLQIAVHFIKRMVSVLFTAKQRIHAHGPIFVTHLKTKNLVNEDARLTISLM